MTEYTIALRNMVSGPARAGLRDAEALRRGLMQLEATSASARVRVTGRAAAGIDKTADQTRNAAFRRLMRAQAEEEKFARYRIALDRRVAAEKERAEQQMLRAELRRIQVAQRAEASRAAGIARARQQTRGNALGVLGGALAGGLALGVGAGGAALAYGGGQVFDTAKQIEAAKLRLTALLGSDEAAGAELKDMLRAAAKTKFDWQDLLEATSSLSASFKDAGARRYVLASIADMVTVSGGNKEDLGRVVLAINQVVGKGKLEAEELNQIIEPLKGVVSRREFYLEVAKLLGTSGKDEQAIITKMQALQKQGGIGANVAMQAVTNVGRRKASGGTAREAGAAAIAAGDTLEGIISNIRTGLATLIADANVNEWPGMMALKSALKDIATLFEIDNPAGKEFGRTLASLSTMVTPVIAVARGLVSMAVAMGQNPQLMELVGRGLRQIATGLLAVGGLIGGVIVGALALAGGLEKVIEVTIRWAASGYDAAANFVAGIVQGLSAGLGRVYDAVASVGQTVIDGFKDKLGIRSPSRVAMLMGQQTAEGFAIGLQRSTANVERSANMIPAAAAGGMSRSGARGGAGASVTITNNIIVQGAGKSAMELVEEMGPLLEAKQEAFMDRYFGRQLAQGV